MTRYDRTCFNYANKNTCEHSLYTVKASPIHAQLVGDTPNCAVIQWCNMNLACAATQPRETGTGWLCRVFDRLETHLPGLVVCNKKLWKPWPSRNSWFTYDKWWFSIVLLVYQRVNLCILHSYVSEGIGHPLRSDLTTAQTLATTRGSPFFNASWLERQLAYLAPRCAAECWDFWWVW